VNQNKLQQILDLLDGIKLYEWERLKISVDREFHSQINASKFEKTDTALKNIETDLAIQ
jgi:hypothetical protein